MPKRIVFIMLFLILTAGGFATCSSSNQSASQNANPLVKKQTGQPTAEPTKPLGNLGLLPGWKNVAQKHAVNSGDTVYYTLTTISAQPKVIALLQCRGTGTAIVEIQSTTSTEPSVKLPVSCKAATPEELDYARETFPKNEKDQVIVIVTGKVE